MCGIFGWQFRPNYRPPLSKRAVLAAALGRENVSRGKDSWGWYAADTNDICHGLGSIAGRTHGMAFSHSLIGHTRHATTGATTLENAHPYEIGGIIGAHNGTIGNHRELNEIRKADGLPEYEVDSMHLIDSISRGLDECVDVIGYGSVEWVRQNDPKKIRLCRMTSSGDLRLFMCKEGIIWSSSKGALETAVAEAEFRGFMFDEPKDGAVIDIVNGTMSVSPDKIVIGEYNKGFSGGYAGGHQSSGHTVYGSSGSLVEDYRRRQIEAGEAKREERKKKKELGRAEQKKAEVKPLGSGPMKLCASCYNEVDGSGKCSQGHDCSSQTTLVLNM